MKNTMNISSWLRAAVLVSSVSTAGASHAVATLNFSSIETVLADPSDSMSKMHASWVGWQTQVYEYNMPFIKLENTADSPAILQYKMTIGDKNYRFSNEFKNKAKTNSWDIPANGAFALLGKSTPSISFTSLVEDGDDTLVLNFGNGGLQPGQRVIFQVDIAPNAGATNMQMFSPYTSVFFTPNGHSTTNNSVITIDYAGVTPNSVVTLPNFAIDSSAVVSLSTPRPYNQMQMVPVFPDTTIPSIPEPASLALVASVLGLATGRRGRGC
ncbi:MAG: hypothetical protein ACRCT8_16865 [Lacipirellulaceae bacterium]